MPRMPEQLPTWPNTVTMMFQLARKWRHEPMLRSFRDGAWVGLHWGAFAQQVASVARGLRAAGITPGDRVLLVSENRPEFLIAEVALQALRAIPVPAYTTNTVADHAHVLRDSGATAAIVSTATLAGRVAQAGRIELLICMERGFQAEPLRVLTWDDLAGRHRPARRYRGRSRHHRARHARRDHLHLRHRRRPQRCDAVPPRPHRQLPQRA